MDIRLNIRHKVSDIPVTSCCVSWSPDGTQIAFNGNAERVYVVNIYKGETRQVTPNQWPTSILAWTLDGQGVIFRSKMSINDSLYRIDADGQKLVLLTEEIEGRTYFPILSPDHNFVPYGERQANGTAWKIYWMNLANSESQFLWDAEYGVSPVSVSPSGVHIAFSMYRRNEVIVMNADGSEYQRWPPMQADVRQLLWSLDGAHILYVAQDSVRHFYVYMANINGYILQDLSAKMPRKYVGNFVWSPDGKQILFFSEDDAVQPDIYVMDTDGENLRQLTFSPDIAMSAAWQPQP
jgi:Tol biopolymer transport system component